MTENGVLLEVPLRAELRASAEVRHRLAEVLKSVTPGVADDVRLLTSELVANGVRHGHLAPADEIVVRVAGEGRSLHVEVEHPGQGFDPVISKGDESGWGLWLVDRLSDRWGVSGNGATCVWFDIEEAR